jgi:hypothetical protein
VNEAENTLVLAGHRLNGLKFEPKRFPFPPDESDCAVLCTDCGATPDICSIELKVNYVQQWFAIQFVNFVPCLQTDPVCQGAAFDSHDAQPLCLASTMRRRITVFVNRLFHIS